MAHPSERFDLYAYAGFEQQTAAYGLVPDNNTACNTNFANVGSLPSSAEWGGVGRLRQVAAGFVWKVRVMKPEKQATALIRSGDHYDVRFYQSTHPTGGAIMGSNPSNSVINRYSQSWDLPNLFIYGASAFPQNLGGAPTGLPAGLAYFSAAKTRDTYLKSPRPLVQA